jgi:hypothetical protein
MLFAALPFARLACLNSLRDAFSKDGQTSPASGWMPGLQSIQLQNGGHRLSLVYWTEFKFI